MTDPATPTGFQRSPGGGFRWLPPSAEHLAKLLPQYDIERLLGHGGMGAVYQGTQKSLKRPVAIKILPQGLEDEDASYTGRFKNEAQILARLSHPCIVAVHDFGETSEGQLYIVMEFVDGTDVAQMISAQGKLPPEHALAIAAHVCDALGYAHDHGVVHRDIKPANILINREGAVKVADFGLAKLDEPGSGGLTKTGMAMGTPDYVAPEALITGTLTDGRADLYAVGVMLYHMLTGEVPRGAFDLPSRRIGTDPRFDAIILKAMKMDRGERYQTSAELRRDLDVILTLPLVQAGGASSAAIPQRNTNFPVREEAIPNRKSNKTMITLAATAAVLATGAFLVLKPDVARSRNEVETAKGNSDSENAPQLQNSVSENRATPAAAPSAPPSSPAPKPAINPKPILVAQANTKPKSSPELQLGQSAAADPVPARKPDPAKWVKLNPKTDCQIGGTANEVNGVWTLKEARAHSHQTFRDVAIRANITSLKKALGNHGLCVRGNETGVDAGFYNILIRSTDLSLNRVSFGVGTRKYDILKKFPVSEEAYKEPGIFLTLSVVGPVLTVWLGNTELGSVSDDAFTKGSIAFEANEGTFRDMEYQVLDASAPAVAQAPTPAATPAPPAAPQATLPPELTTLQQQYDKLLIERVTGIYDVDVAKLNAGYLAGLDRASATAQSGGELDTVLAITAEKKLLEAKQPMPATDDAKTPEALKNLRTIYRSSLAKLDEQRTANHTALLTPYVTRLKQIEADLTKAGRIPDAVAVKQYREGLGTNSGPTTPAFAATSATATTPMKEAPAATPAVEAKLPKGDSRAAVEWVLDLGGNVRIEQGGNLVRLRTGDALPKGKFVIKEVALTFLTTPPNKPVTDQDMDRLAGLDELTSIIINKLNITGAGLRFLTTCPKLANVSLHNFHPGDEGFRHLSGLSELRVLDFNASRKITSAQLRMISHLPIEYLGLAASELTDADLETLAQLGSLRDLLLRYNSGLGDDSIASIKSCKKLEFLDITNTNISPTAIAGLKGLPLSSLYCGKSDTKWDIVTFRMIAALFPKLEAFGFPGDGPVTGTDIQLLVQAFPALKSVNMHSSQPERGALASLAGLTKLEKLFLYKASTLTDDMIGELAATKKLSDIDAYGTPLTDAAFAHFAKIKSLRSLVLGLTKVTDAGVAVFKKDRPDVQVYR